MLDHLKKYFAKAETPVAEATQLEKEESMTTTTEQPVLTADNQTAELVAQLAAQTATLEDLQAKFAELNTKYAEATAALAGVEAKAAELKLAARKEKLENAVGTEKAATLLSTLDGLDDAAFDSVVSCMKVNLEQEQSSPAFTESGVTAAVDAEKVAEANSIKAKLEKKYKSN